MKLYSLKEIRQVFESDGIHIPDGTLRNYRDEFSDILPSEGSGRFTRYHEGALAMFKEIRKLRKEDRLDAGQIRERLKQMTGASDKGTETTNTTSTAKSSVAISPELVFSLVESVRSLEVRSKIIQDHVVKLVSILQQRFIMENEKHAALTTELRNVVTELHAATQHFKEMSGTSGEVPRHTAYNTSLNYPLPDNRPNASGNILESQHTIEVLEKHGEGEKTKRTFIDRFVNK